MTAILKRGFAYKLHTYIIASRRNNYRPKLLRTPYFLLASCLVASLLIVSSVLRLEVRSAGLAESVTDEERIVGAINVARGQNDLQLLSLNEQLSKAAAAKQLHMAENEYWDHTSPDGVEPWPFVRAYNVTYASAAETLARGFGSPESVVNGWLQSTTHRDALLEASYSQVGISITEDDNGYDVVALFIQPVSSIASTTGVLSDTTSNPAQKVLAFNSPDTSRISSVIPQILAYILMGLFVLNSVLLIMMIFTQHKIPAAEHVKRQFHELPEVHMVVDVAIIGLLVSSFL